MSQNKQTKHKIIIYWDKIGKNRGAFLNKLYGYKIKKKRYVGLIKKLGGKKIGKSCMMIPFKEFQKISPLLKKYKVKSKNLKIFTGE